MRTTLVILALVGCSLAFPQRQVVPVISRTQQQDASGQYLHSYQSGDGATVQETGALKPTNDGTDQVVVKQGSYAYTSPEGFPVQVTYVADEYGFKPSGNVIPVPVQPIAPTF